MVQAVSAVGRPCGLQQLPDLGGRTYMMPGRVIPEMAASPSIPCCRICQKWGVQASCQAVSLFPGGGFQFGNPFRADLMDDAAQFLDAFTKPCQLFLGDFIMFGIARLGISLL